MEKRRKQVLYYYCDEKYSLWHKWKEPKLFQIDANENNFDDEAPSTEVTKEEKGEPLIDLENDTLAMQDEMVISLHALTNYSSPQLSKFEVLINIDQ